MSSCNVIWVACNDKPTENYPPTVQFQLYCFGSLLPLIKLIIFSKKLYDKPLVHYLPNTTPQRDKAPSVGAEQSRRSSKLRARHFPQELVGEMKTELKGE